MLVKPFGSSKAAIGPGVKRHAILRLGLQEIGRGFSHFRRSVPAKTLVRRDELSSGSIELRSDPVRALRWQDNKLLAVKPLARASDWDFAFLIKL